MNTIYLIRHGDIDNPDEILYLRMDKDMPLTDAGRQQARLIANHLKQNPPHHLYSSPLYRTQETAEIIAQELHMTDVIFDDRLLEVASPLQGITFTEFSEKWQMSLYHPELYSQGGETIEQVWQRMSSALSDFCNQHPNQSLAVVSHGDPLKITWLGMAKLPFTAMLVHGSHPQFPSEYPQKGSVTTVDFDGVDFKIKDYWESQVV